MTESGGTDDGAILELVRRFEAAAVPRAEWTHEAHLTVALALLHLDPEHGARRIRDGIIRLNAANGVAQTPTGGYHETITAFYVAVIRSFLAETEASTLPAKLALLLARHGDRELPLRHYSRELLFSWDARTHVVPPDLAPVPGLERAGGQP